MYVYVYIRYLYKLNNTTYIYIYIYIYIFFSKNFGELKIHLLDDPYTTIPFMKENAQMK